jgi:antitoxin component of MazEF toxin-antitoxin module
LFQEIPMTKTLTKHGNSLALVIDKPILELLGIDAQTQLSVQTDGTGLYISPTDPTKRRQFESALSKVMTEWHGVLQHLAE